MTIAFIKERTNTTMETIVAPKVNYPLIPT